MCFCFSDLKPPETAWLAAGEWLVFFVYFPLRPVFFQWEFQDPKMEVLYHIRLCFVGIFPYIGLT